MEDGQSELPPSRAPWINHEVQQKIGWRDGDVVISVPVKSGTTWTMNIVHQLRSGGDRDFEDIYVEVPWLELLTQPGETVVDRARRIDSMPNDRRRVFKSHSAPPQLPFFDTGADLRYVVVLRNPEEAMVSLKPFFEKHRREWFELWGSPHETFSHPDFQAFYQAVAWEFGITGSFFQFTAAWWPLRDRPNVQLIHFADMKRDHEGTIRKIAEFLGYAPSPTQWATILECTSFAWMKAHDHKFEAAKAAVIPILERGAMVRKGQAGAARDDGMTDEIARDIAARGRELLTDEAAFEWLYNGGPLAEYD